MWLLHWLPLPLLAAVGRGVGLLLYLLVGDRRHVTQTNLGLCFPQLSAAQKAKAKRASSPMSALSSNTTTPPWPISASLAA